MKNDLEFDKGPSKSIAKIFNNYPDYSFYKDSFWYDWGPVFYRGRLDRSAKILCIASDPGPTERVALRTLVGDAGQRVQGFLAKLGITSSYLCLNALIYALHPSHLGDAKRILEEQSQIKWRNKLFNILTGDKLQAIIAFGVNAQLAVDLWDNKPSEKVFKTYHPSYHDETKLIQDWRKLILQLREKITPDSDGNNTRPNYGSKFTEDDYKVIPKRDLPFGVPEWFGDDSWGRKSKPRHNNCVSRPNPDDNHTLVWIAPKS